jgi:small multidrug resistance pump
MSPWGLLSAAIGLEVAATLSLRASHGLTRLPLVAAVVAGYAGSFVLLAFVLNKLPVGIVYAIWSAVGIVAVAILGRVLFGDPVPPLAAAGMVVIILGVTLVQLSASQVH